MEQIANTDQLCSTGHYIQCLVITYNGKESKKAYKKLIYN